MKFKKGFTLIELLVVVSIIGLLATVVLAGLGAARNKARDAKIKSNLFQMRAQAEIQALDNNGSYSTLCDSGTIGHELFLSSHRIAGPSGPVNNVCWDENGAYYHSDPAAPLNNHGGGAGLDPVTGSAWAVEVHLSTGELFCVDGVGGSGIYLSRTTEGVSPDKTCG